MEQSLFEKLGYGEDGTTGVLVLEARALPTADVIEWVAGRSGLVREVLGRGEGSPEDQEEDRGESDEGGHRAHFAGPAPLVRVRTE